MAPQAPVDGDDKGVALDLRVLVVEDHAEICRLFALMLCKHGCLVETCHSGLSAITIAPLFKPDVLLLDLGLPAMDGYEVTRHLRDEMGPERPYIIAITAYIQERFRWKAAQAGVDCYLTKPVSSQDLFEHLAQFQAQRDSSRRPVKHESPVLGQPDGPEGPSSNSSSQV